MRQRNWSLILPAAAIAGFAPFALAGSAAFGVLAAFLAPIALVTVFAWRDWQERQAAEELENARLAAFVKARDAAPPAASAQESPTAPPAVAAPANVNPAMPPAAKPAAAPLPAAATSAKLAAPGATPAAAAGPAAPAANAAAGASGAERAAALAILEALAAKDGARATALFQGLGARRSALQLSPTDWGRVGAAALAQGAFLDAAWALHAGALLAGDTAAAQKHLVAVADKANAAGDARVALKLYANLLKKYPASPFADFVRNSMRALQKKVDKA
jgi:hypothetical protein